MKKINSTGWLLENGGPIIRYLAATELTPDSLDTARLTSDLLRNDRVQQWMNCLTGLTGFSDIHGSRDTCLENALGKLAQFGLRKGMGDLDRRCKKYLVWLQKSKAEGKRDVIGVFKRAAVASMLALAGYSSENVVRETVLDRLDVIYDFVRKGDYSIYADKTRFKGIPHALKHYPLVHSDLHPDGDFALPWIYDLFAFGVIYDRARDESLKDKIDNVISYIINPAYQKLHDGYGVVHTRKNRYNVMGWNVWLPGYNGMHTGDFKMGCRVQRLELMSHFPSALSSTWFKNSLTDLEKYVTGSNTYRFPKQYIKERKDSYFVSGAHMGLGENRRHKLAYEIESTFWILKIKKNIMGRQQLC